MLAELSRRRVTVSTTLGVNEIIYSSDRFDDVVLPGDQVYIHPQNLRALRSLLPVMSAQDHRRARDAMPKVLEFARRLHAAGVPILLGTDGTGGGPAYSRELQLHARAGLETWDVLRLATADGAAHLGIGNRTGRISEGMEADVVFLQSNPLTDIARARDVGLVLSNGNAYAPADLLGALAGSSEK